MKNYSILMILCLAATWTASAQDGPSGKTLASTMEVYVFPEEGQQTDQQSKDEATCYEWATGHGRTDGQLQESVQRLPGGQGLSGQVLA